MEELICGDTPAPEFDAQTTCRRQLCWCHMSKIKKTYDLTMFMYIDVKFYICTADDVGEDVVQKKERCNCRGVHRWKV